MPEPNISTCQDVGMWQIFVRWWYSLVVFVAGVRVVEFGSYGWQRRRIKRGRRRLHTRPTPLLGLLYCQGLRAWATGRAAAYNVASNASLVGSVANILMNEEAIRSSVTVVLCLHVAGCMRVCASACVRVECFDTLFSSFLPADAMCRDGWPAFRHPAARPVLPARAIATQYRDAAGVPALSVGCQSSIVTGSQSVYLSPSLSARSLSLLASCCVLYLFTLCAGRQRRPTLASFFLSLNEQLD